MEQSNHRSTGKWFEDLQRSTSMSSDAVRKLKLNPDDETAYRVLLETIYWRIILLNRRRPGEVRRMEHSTYTNVTQNQQNYEEFDDLGSPTEKILVPGKRNRGVPVLFSEDLQEHIQIPLSAQSNFLGNPQRTTPMQVEWKIQLV